MFFIVSKLLGAIFEPVNFMALWLLTGVLLTWGGFLRTGRILTAAAAIVFMIACFSPAGSLLMQVLEDRFPHPPAAMPAPTGIIVLGGSLDEELSYSRNEITMPHAAARLTSAVALARRYPAARLVFTGGAADLGGTLRDEAAGVQVLWRSLGVPDSQMTFETKSRNTFENAIFTRDIVATKPGETWLLITSAAHMPRSVGIFRRAGFTITPYPVDYLTFGDRRDWEPALNGLRSLERIDVALHEWVGLGAYWLTGKTDALFPGP